jgi:hypothetical protein
MLIPKKGVFQGVVATVGKGFHTRLRGGLGHADDLYWSLRKRGRRNGAWPGNTKHAICQRRVYVLDLETRRHVDCALESAVLYFFHRIHDKRRVCISEKWRGPTVARDRESTIMGQMDAYFLFLEAWELKCSTDEVRLRLITYFDARTHDLSTVTLSGSYSPAVGDDQLDILGCKSAVERTEVVCGGCVGGVLVSVHGEGSAECHEVKDATRRNL